MMEAILTISFWGFVFWVCWKWFLRNWFNSLSATKTAKAQMAARTISDEVYYEIAAREVQDNQIRPGLWAKAWADAQGDDTKAKALYLKLRVATLKDEAAESFRKYSDGGAGAAIEDKVIVVCPYCSGRVRLPAGKAGSVDCGHCHRKFEAST
jgi:uncharacterized Zn-finger protein